jgi:hypothetical protein
MRKFEFDFDYFVYGSMNHVRLKAGSLPPNVNTAQNAARKWIK